MAVPALATLGGSLLGALFPTIAKADDLPATSLTPERWLMTRTSYGPSTFQIAKADMLMKGDGEGEVGVDAE